MERLADLDELVLRCRSDEARAYISEAVGAYRIGSYRSAIASTWVAVVYDVISKIREIALTGNLEAKKIAADLSGIYDEIHKGSSSAIQKALKFEREILEIARDRFELIDQIQFEDLSRLRDDRNRCAHPSFHLVGSPYAPSAEQARVHIRNSISHVLSQPPVLGKAAVASILTIIESDYFPAQIDKARVQLTEAGFRRPNLSLIHGVIDALMFGVVEKGSSLYLKRKAIIALAAIVQAEPLHSKPRLTSNLSKQFKISPDQTVLQLGLAVIVDIPDIWELCTQAVQDMMIEFVRTQKLALLLRALDRIRNIPALKDAFDGRVSAMPADELETLIDGYQEPSAVDRSVELFAQSRSWNVANQRQKSLLAPIAARITKDHVLSVIRTTSQGQNDLKHSAGLYRFLSSALELELLTRAELQETLENFGLEAEMPAVDESSPVQGDPDF